nr:hypothetical protein [Mycobacterium lepromatosis]
MRGADGGLQPRAHVLIVDSAPVFVRDVGTGPRFHRGAQGSHEPIEFVLFENSGFVKLA